MLLVSSKLCFFKLLYTEKIQLGPSKLKYVLNHGIAPYVKDILKNGTF